MLLGSDMLIVSNEKYVAISLHLWDVAGEVTPLTWLEAKLDNEMAPELAICYHDNGVVQGYELLKTDDIFLLKVISDDGTPRFHTHVVHQNGLSVMKFLQDNCKQDPGLIGWFVHMFMNSLPDLLICHEELELTSESYLLESDVTVTDLEDESSEGCLVQQFKILYHLKLLTIHLQLKFQSSGPNSSMSKMGTDLQTDAATEVEGLMNGVFSSVKHDILDMYQISSTSSQVARAVADPISSKLAAIHHVSQAIKSLRLETSTSEHARRSG